MRYVRGYRGVVDCKQQRQIFSFFFLSSSFSTIYDNNMPAIYVIPHNMLNNKEISARTEQATQQWKFALTQTYSVRTTERTGRILANKMFENRGRERERDGAHMFISAVDLRSLCVSVCVPVFMDNGLRASASFRRCEQMCMRISLCWVCCEHHKKDLFFFNFRPYGKSSIVTEFDVEIFFSSLFTIRIVIYQSLKILNRVEYAR